MLLIDPARSAGSGFTARVEALLAAPREAGAERLPANTRRARRLAAAGGIKIT